MGTLALGLLGGVGLACGDGDAMDGDGGGTCTPGMQIQCACPGGVAGVQVCSIDGASFGACDCGGGTGGETDGETETEGPGTGDGTTGGSCGNGVEEVGECDDTDPAYCPADCGGVDTGDSTGTTGADSCAGEPVYVAMVPSMPSRWVSGALTGFAAGQDLCRQTATTMGVPDPMEVTVCDYEQVVQAEMAGELASIPAGTSAWLHRTTVADVGGVPSPPGSGGRCVDWTYETNHISDGEYVDIGAGGVATYTLDNDTFYDGVDTTHTQPGMLECGTQMRAILCCNPECVGEG